MRNVTVAAIQMSIPETPEKSVEKAEKLVRKAAAEGANVILLPELFENWYFCQERRYDSYKLALPLEENPAVRRFQAVAKELSVALPISFYEQDGNVLYNSVAMIDADGSVMGVYRKTHIPDDHFYQEKFYFTPGERLAASYVNFYISNGAVVMPFFSDPADEPARAKLQELFPERRVIPVYARDILIGGGNIHCITQQIPAFSEEESQWQE